MSFVFKVWFFVLLILDFVRVLIFVFRVYSALFSFAREWGGRLDLCWVLIHWDDDYGYISPLESRMTFAVLIIKKFDCFWTRLLLCLLRDDFVTMFCFTMACFA